jgi:hypothetical protein
MKSKIVVFLSSCLLSSFIISQAVAQVGVIPMSFMGNPAKDLFNKDRGRVYSRSELLRLNNSEFDLSSIDPKKTDIWDGVGANINNGAIDDLGIESDQVYKFVDKIAAPIGVYRFSIRDDSEANQQKHYGVWVAKDSRAILLRKNLLRKLGYKAPKTAQVDKLKIKFKGMVSLKAFIEKLEVSTFADSKRWLIEKNEDDFVLTLQDVLVIESNFLFYNLTTGEIPGNIISHRRVLNALAIPLAICDVRESVDGLAWSLGKIDNKQLLLDTLGAGEFTTTYNDARWVLRRMAKFTEQDFKDIVAQAHYPESVSLLLVEKLKSRFLSLYKHFGLPKITKNRFPVTSNISDKKGELIRGRLTNDSWDGHAARYSFDDTESPLSRSEIGAYFRSRIYSSVLANLVTYFNDNYLYDTDIQAEAIKRQIQAKKDQIIKLLETGKFETIPFSAWAIPTARGNINVSRDIVTGSYLGTDNRIQIADTLEFVGGVGVFIGTLGLPVQYSLYANAGAQFSRSYTHVKSIKSMKKALKEPFRNILVPRLKNQKTATLQDIINQLQHEDFTSLEEDDKDTKLTEILKTLKDVLGVGESLIISSNLVVQGSVTAGVTVEIVDALINLNANRINLWRFHIVRTDENTIQIYKSRAASVGRGFGFQLKAYIPIISLSTKKNKGNVNTEFNSLSLDKRQPTDDLVRNLVEFKQILANNSFELLNARKKPFVIQHNFVERSSDSKFFWNKGISVELTDNIKITHPEGFETDLVIRSKGKLKGKDYQQVAVEVLNAIIEEALDFDNVEFTNPGSGNPGDSYRGKSFSRMVTYEEPQIVKGTDLPFTPYAEIKSQWRGWKAGPNTIKGIQKFVHEKYGEDIFPDDMFRGTKQIQLYNVDVAMSIYDEGIDNLLKYDRDWFEKVINLYLEMPILGRALTKKEIKRRKRSKDYEKKRSRVVKKILRAYKRLRPENRYIMSPNARAKDIETVINVSEMMLPFDIFSKLLGGSDYYYLKGYVNGFRVGVENGEESIISHSLGEYGSEFTKGTFNTLREAIKISTGELGSYWFLRRLQ